MHLIMGYGFYKYYYGVRELKYVFTIRTIATTDVGSGRIF